MVTVLDLLDVRPIRRPGIPSYFGGRPFSSRSLMPLSLKVLLAPAPLLHPIQDVAYSFYTHFIPKVPILSINIKNYNLARKTLEANPVISRREFRRL
ncbi:MAG: hypothetical protein K0R55_2868 [Sporomusa sp.]|nr:hypothetical protein [Sporomusa sp.]